MEAMGYIACANCGNLNKDDATTCYSCEQELVAPPPPPPSEPAPVEENPWSANLDVRVQPLNPNAGGDPTKARFKDLSSRYEARKVPQTNANIMHGLRSGLPAGLLAGVFMGFYRKHKVDEMTRLLVRKHPKMDKHGPEIFGYSVGFDLFLGLILGFILGLTNLLCFPREATTTGAIVGAIAGGVLVYLVGVADYAGVILGAVNGGVMGALASLIERKLFRGQ
jgi:hypothetical protein